MSVILLRLLILCLSTLGILWFIIPIFTNRIINIGNMTGIIFCSSVFLYTLLTNQINSIISTIWAIDFGKIILIAFSLLLGIIICLVIIASSLMIHALHKEELNDATVIVLGCRVYGERASLMLCERLDAAYDYLIVNKDANCILSGGQGSGEEISEAECMYRYLIDLGIESNRLYKEDKSTSTRENLAFSKLILDKYNLNSHLAIVTNEFHEYRAQCIAKELGLNTFSVAGQTAWWLFATYYVRELYGIIYQWIL